MKNCENTTKSAAFSITIDGPASAGKSTVAKRLSALMQIVHVDTGAMYRALGLCALEQGVDPGDGKAVIPMLEKADVTLEYLDGKQHILLNGRDITGEIRTEEVSQAASVISTIPEVREKLLLLQRELARVECIVMDGRDIGTVVLPEAKHKFFITASAEVRAKRRYIEYEASGKLGGRSFEALLSEIRERDYRDENREVAPLRPAEDAVIIDTSELGIDEVVAEVLRAVAAK